MARHLAHLLILLLAACVCLVKATQITVDGQDQSIQYHTIQDGDGNATWVVVQRSSDSCDTPQMLTSRIGDYMVFTFTGTGFQVIGTVGKKRGLIQFALDGQNTTVKDRSSQQLVCNSVLYEVHNLPDQQHTVMGTLIGKDINYSSGQLDGVFSVQRIRYDIPGGGSSNVGAIAGGVVGGLIALVAAAVGVWWYLKRKRQQEQNPRRASAGAFIDSDDVPGHLQGKAEMATSPGLIATPFEWSGPGSQYNPPPSMPYHDGITPTTETGTMFASPPGTNANLGPSSYFQPAAGARTTTYSTSSVSDGKRESNLNGTPGVAAALGYAVHHPDSPETIMASPRTSVQPGPGGDNRQSTAIDDTHLVDRIANRLADIMTTRTGGVGVMDHIVPPPVYTGPGGPGGRNDEFSPGHVQQPLPQLGSPEAGQSALPYHQPSGPTQLPYAQYQYQTTSPPPPEKEQYPGSNRF